MQKIAISDGVLRQSISPQKSEYLDWTAKELTGQPGRLQRSLCSARISPKY
jgi:hypothetical protein